jgi:1-acyl-sn-glycerol-3-phosphate acyltransferase
MGASSRVWATTTRVGDLLGFPIMWGDVVGFLDRTWRLFGTGLSFAFFGIGGFLLGAMYCSILRLIIHDPVRYAQAVRRVVSAAFRMFVWFMAAVGVLRWRVEGMPAPSAAQGCLVVANHPSLIDIVFLIGIFDGADCVVKADVLRNPAFGLLTRAADYVSNDDAGVFIEQTIARLRAGRTVVMFPEGTRTVPGKPLAFSTAAGAILARSGCAAIPVVVTCDPPTLYKGLPWYRIPPRRPTFVLRGCEPVRAPGAADPRLAAREFTATLQQFFTAELARTAGGEMAVSGPAEPVRTSI